MGDTVVDYINQGSVLIDAVDRANADKASASAYIDTIVAACNDPNAAAGK